MGCRPRTWGLFCGEGPRHAFGYRQHLFCDPDTGQRRAIGLKVGEELRTHAMTVSKETGREWTDVHDAERKKQLTREAVWLQCLQGCEPSNRSIIFVCGADHVDTFRAALDAKKICWHPLSRLDGRRIGMTAPPKDKDQYDFCFHRRHDRDALEMG